MGSCALEAGRALSVKDFPAVGQPVGQVADFGLGQVHQQLRKIKLRIDIVPAAGTGEAGQDGGGTATTTAQLENSTEDAYFRRYKLLSTAYRFCAFLGWLELYRQEITYLHSGSSRHSRELEGAIHFIREDLADGQLNKAKDWQTWRDVLVFREELRAIGESMIETHNAARTVMGYGRFVELFDSQDGSSTQRWAHVLLNFILDLDVERRDFRRVRLQRLVVHLVGLLDLLDKNSVEEYLREARDQCKSVIREVRSGDSISGPVVEVRKGKSL